MKEKKKEPSAFGWVLIQAGEHRSQYIKSVLFAVIGVCFSVAPFFVVSDIIKMLMEGSRDIRAFMSKCIIMAVFWRLRVLFHSLSTANSHVRTFRVLGEIRKKGTDKLARMPLGDVISYSSGALKNILVERIDSIETTLAHIVPEFTRNLLIPVVVLIYIFTINVKMGFAAMATIPIGRLCYFGMMLTSRGYYERTVTATKELNNTAVEYINGRIVDSGTHSQLMDHSGLYRNFVSERKEAVSWKVKNA